MMAQYFCRIYTYRSHVAQSPRLSSTRFRSETEPDGSWVLITLSIILIYKHLTFTHINYIICISSGGQWKREHLFRDKTFGFSRSRSVPKYCHRNSIKTILYYIIITVTRCGRKPSLLLFICGCWLS